MQSPNGDWRFSIHEAESGQAIWLSINQQRKGYQITSYDPETSTIDISINGQSSYLTLIDSDNIPLQILFSPNQLSQYNRELLKSHKQLIKFPQSTDNTSTQYIEARKEALGKAKQLKELLITNPGTQEVNQLIGELGDSIDYAALMQINPGPVVASRNEQNTAGWGIRKDVDHQQLAVTLRGNPTLEEIHELVLAE